MWLFEWLFFCNSSFRVLSFYIFSHPHNSYYRRQVICYNKIAPLWSFSYKKKVKGITAFALALSIGCCAWTAYRKSHPEVFCKKGVLWNFRKFSGKQLCQSLFFNKLVGLKLIHFKRESLISLIILIFIDPQIPCHNARAVVIKIG